MSPIERQVFYIIFYDISWCAKYFKKNNLILRIFLTILINICIDHLIYILLTSTSLSLFLKIFSRFGLRIFSIVTTGDSNDKEIMKANKNDSIIWPKNNTIWEKK